MAPLATAWVTVLPNTALFAPAMVTGLRGSTAAAATAGSAAGSAYSFGFAKMMAIGVGVAMAVVVKKSVEAAGDFEAAMVRLTTSAGETGTLVSGNLKIVADGIKAMAAPVGYTLEQLGKGMYLVESAGFRAADGLKVLRAAAEGAKAENSDLSTVVDALTTTMIDYHKPASEANDVMTKMVAAAAASKVNLNDMAKSLHSVLPAASAAGISLDDILGSLSSMTLHGYSAQQATQNLADVIRHMQNPTNVQARELALLGLTTNQLADDLRSKGLSGTLQMISTRIKNLMPPGQQQVILQLQKALSALPKPVRELGMQLVNGTISFADYRAAAREMAPVATAQAMQFYQLAAATHRIGDVQMSGKEAMQAYSQALAKATGDATGMNVALMLTGENAAVTNEIIAGVAAATTEAGGHIRGWAAIQETFNFKLAATKAALSVVSVEIGESLLPVVGALLEKITEILGPMTEWISKNEQLTQVVVSLVSAFLLLGTATLVLQRVIVTIRLMASAMFLGRAATLAWAAALSVWNGIMFLVPILTNRANFQIAMYLLWSKLAAAATKVWAGVQLVFNAIITASPIGLIIVAIIAVVAAVIYAYTHFDGFRKFVDNLWKSIKVAAVVIWDALVVAFRAVGAAAMWLWENALGPAFRFIMAATKIWWEYAKLAFNFYVAAIKAVATVVLWWWEHVMSPVYTFAGKVIQAWWVIAQVVFAWFRVMLDLWVVVPLKNMWAIAQPIWDGMVFLLKVWWEYAKFVFNMFMNLLDFWVITPLKNMWEVAKLVWKLFTGAVSAWWEYVKFAFDLFKKGVDIGLIQPTQRMWTIVKLIFEAFIKIVRDDLPAAFRKAVDLITALWDALKGAVAAPINAVIRFVINDGIIKAWNTLAGWLGVKDRIPPLDPVKFADGGSVGEGAKAAYANGGLLRGIGGPRQDNIPILASAGEYVIPANVVRDMGVGWFDNLIGKKPMRPGDGSSGIAIGRYAAGGLIGAITDPAGWVGDQVNGLVNKIPGGGIVHDIGVAASRKLISGLIAWVKSKVGSLFGGDTSNYLGPITGSLAGIAAWLKAQNGKPYGWAQAGPGSYDCSGIISAVWNLMHGVSPYRHTFSTAGQSLFFPKRNQYGILTAGWANPGERGGGSVGHTAGVFAGLGFESTGSRGVRVGGGTTDVRSFAHWGTFADGGLIRSFDRGGSWPSGTVGVNTSGRTEHVVTGGGMDRMLALLERIEAAVQKVGPAVGKEMNGSATVLRSMSRTR